MWQTGHRWTRLTLLPPINNSRRTAPQQQQRQHQTPHMALSSSTLPFSPVLLLLAGSSNAPRTPNRLFGGRNTAATVFTLAATEDSSSKGPTTDELAGLEAEVFGALDASVSASSFSSSAAEGSSNNNNDNARTAQRQKGQVGQKKQQQQQAPTPAATAALDTLNAMLSGQGARGRSIEPRAHSL